MHADCDGILAKFLFKETEYHCVSVRNFLGLQKASHDMQAIQVISKRPEDQCKVISMEQDFFLPYAKNNNFCFISVIEILIGEK